MLKRIRDSETSTSRRIRVKEYKSRRGKSWSPATSVGICILVSVDIHKNAMGVVPQITRLQTAPRRHGIDKAAHKVQAQELIQSRKEAALLRIQLQGAAEVEKDHKQVAECFL